MGKVVTVLITAHKHVEIDLNQVYHDEGIKLTSKKAIKDYAFNLGPDWGSIDVEIQDITDSTDNSQKLKKGRGSY